MRSLLHRFSQHETHFPLEAFGYTRTIVRTATDTLGALSAPASMLLFKHIAPFYILICPCQSEPRLNALFNLFCLSFVDRSRLEHSLLGDSSLTTFFSSFSKLLTMARYFIFKVTLLLTYTSAPPWRWL